jgi:hypothetical protein
MIPYNVVPAPRLLVIPRRPRMGVVEGERPKAFIDSPIVAFVTDLAAAIPSGLIAFTYQKAGSKWSNFFWGVTVAASLKALIDLSRIQQR